MSTAPIVTPAAAAAVVVDEADDLGDWLKAKAGQTISVADILGAAADIVAGLDSEDMGQIPAMDRWDSPNGARWNAHQSPPAPGGEMDGFITIAIFVGDQADNIGDYAPGEGRLYVMPREITPASVFYRYTFSRIPGSGGHRAQMGLRLFIEEIGRELTRMAVVCDVLEDPDEDDE